MATSDREREAVLRQNELLRQMDLEYLSNGERSHVFQRLRRCCICLRSSCKNQSKCRAALEEWTKRKWAGELQKEHERRSPDEPSPRFRDGH